MYTYKDVIKFVKKEIINDIYLCIGFALNFAVDIFKFTDAVSLILSTVSIFFIFKSCFTSFNKDKRFIQYVSEDYMKYETIFNAIFSILIIASIFKINKYMFMADIVCGIGLLINGFYEIKSLKDIKPEVSIVENETSNDKN